MNQKPIALGGFLGMNNVLDPLMGGVSGDGKAQSWEWLSQADNVDISDQGRLSRRTGFVPFMAGSNIQASFSTFDYRHMYVVDGGVLKEILPDGTAITLKSGLAGPYQWAEVNDRVFLSCSEKLQITRQREVIQWGIPTPEGGSVSTAGGMLPPGLYQVCFTHISADMREGGAGPSIPFVVVDGGMAIKVPLIAGHVTAIYLADRGTVFRALAVVNADGGGVFTLSGLTAGSLGREIETQFLDGPPAGIEHIAHWKGRMYGAEYLPELDQTAVWASQPLGHHLFNHNQDFFIVPGRVTQMADADDVLLIATSERVFLYNEEALAQVAEYGAIPGHHADRGSDGKTYFWTTRGLCRVVPFENITEGRVSVAPGIKAGGGVIHEHGRVRYVATLQSGGAAFNKR